MVPYILAAGLLLGGLASMNPRSMVRAASRQVRGIVHRGPQTKPQPETTKWTLPGKRIMAKVKTAVTDGGAELTGTFTLYHAEELYSEKRPLHTLSIDGGGVSCGLAAAYWNGNVGRYCYDLSSLGVGSTWEIPGESYEEGKGVFVCWIGESVWAGEDPETKYQNAGVVATALITKTASDPTPWTVSANYSLAVSACRLYRERTSSPTTGRDAAPVYAHETKVEDTWQIVNPGSVVVSCGAATLSDTQTWNAAVEQWNPILTQVDPASLGWYPHGGASGRDYGAISLQWDGEDMIFTDFSKSYAVWGLAGDGATLTLSATANSDADAGPYTVGIGRPLIVDFSGVSCKKVKSGDAVNVRVAGGFKADPRYPQTFGWSTTP